MVDDGAVPSSAEEVNGTWLASVLGTDERFSGAHWTEMTSTQIGEGFGLDGMLLQVRVPGSATPSLVVKLAAWSGDQTEPHFYKTIAPHMPCRLPTCYGTASAADRFVLLLEDLSAADQGDCLVGASDAQTRALVAAVGRYHARFWGGTDPVVADRDQFTFEQPSDNHDDHCQRFLQRFSSDVGPQGASLLDSLPELASAAAKLLASSTPTFVHTDLHLDNVLFLGDEPVILDWPGAALGPGVIDLARILIEAMTRTQRQRRHSSLVALYRDVLRHEGISGPSPPQFDDQLAAACVWMCWTTFLWAGSEDPGLERPRVFEIVQSVVRNSFGAAQDGWLRTL